MIMKALKSIPEGCASIPLEQAERQLNLSIGPELTDDALVLATGARVIALRVRSATCGECYFYVAPQRMPRL